MFKTTYGLPLRMRRLSISSSLMLRQVDEALRPWRRLVASTPKIGWIRTIRRALGMTTTQLATRLSVTRQQVTWLEKAEVDDRLTLNSLRKAADALDCTVVYALVPKKSLQEMRESQARRVAQARIAPVAYTMGLEAQSLSDRDNRQQLEDLVAEILREKSARLWD